MNTNEAVERIARAGSTQRHRDWWEQRAAIRSRQYDGRPEWHVACDENGATLLARHKRPLVQAGEAAALITQLHDVLAGEDALPTIEVFEGADESASADTDAARKVADIVKRGLGLPGSLELPALDILLGSCALAFSRPDVNNPGRHEWLRLQPEWADVVWTGQEKTPKARAYAAQLARTSPDLGIPTDEAGPYLPEPVDPKPGDLAFLRYQIRLVEEVPSFGLATETRVYWHRTDYTAQAIVPYAPVLAADTRAPADFRPLPTEPHGWGLVPVVWLRAPKAEPGDLDGPSLLSPSVLSVAEQVDILHSFGTASCNRNADPDVYTVDLLDADAAAMAGVYPDLPGPKRATGGRSMRFQSAGEKPEIGLLESTGEPQKAARDEAQALRDILSQNTGIARHNPEAASGFASGEAMKRAMRPFLARASAYRGRLTAGITRLIELEFLVLVAESVIPAGTVITSSVTWPEVVTPTAADALAWAQVATQLVAVGWPVDAAVKFVATKIGSEDPEEIGRLAAETAEKRMAAARTRVGA